MSEKVFDLLRHITIEQALILGFLGLLFLVNKMINHQNKIAERQITELKALRESVDGMSHELSEHMINNGHMLVEQNRMLTSIAKNLPYYQN